MENMEEEAHQLVELYAEIGGIEKLTDAISIYDKLQPQSARMVFSVLMIEHTRANVCTASITSA